MDNKAEMKFKDMPKIRKFETERRTLFKPEDGTENMAFAESMEIEIRVSAIRNEETRKELEAFADWVIIEAKKIIAEHEMISNGKEGKGC